MDNKRQSIADIRTKYAETRQLVYERVEEVFNGVCARGISLADTQRADLWKNVPQTGNRAFRSSWEWTRVYTTYQSRPSRFEISLWRAGTLCALSYGRLSRSGNRLRLDLLEATPAIPSPLGGPAMPILAFAAGVYASITGATEVWVMDPDPRLESLYKREGFGDRIRYDRGPRIGQRRIL